MFYDSLNVSGSATPNGCSRCLPKTVHNWIGMVKAFCQGISSAGLPTFLSYLFVMHQPQYLSVMKAETQFLDFKILAV